MAAEFSNGDIFAAYGGESRHDRQLVVAGEHGPGHALLDGPFVDASGMTSDYALGRTVG